MSTVAGVEPTPVAGEATDQGEPGTTYVLVDGENIDATLGMSLLGHRPSPDERPRWDRLLSFAERTFAQPARGLFFLNASSGSMPMSFVQALTAIGFRAIPLAGSGDEKVVDVGIQRTLSAIGEREGDVLLVSHDGDFIDEVRDLLDVPSPSGARRRVGVVGFREYVNIRLASLSTHGMRSPDDSTRGLRLYDLESDVDAFTTLLPRVRVIPLDSFDPSRYL